MFSKLINLIYFSGYGGGNGNGIGGGHGGSGGIGGGHGGGAGGLGGGAGGGGAGGHGGKFRIERDFFESYLQWLKYHRLVTPLYFESTFNALFISLIFKYLEDRAWLCNFYFIQSVVFFSVTEDMEEST